MRRLKSEGGKDKEKEKDKEAEQVSGDRRIFITTLKINQYCQCFAFPRTTTFSNVCQYFMSFKQDIINIINYLWYETDVCSISAHSYAHVIRNSWFPAENNGNIYLYGKIL